MTPSARARASVTRTKVLGSERMARRLLDALPGGEQPLRTTVWEFLGRRRG